MFGKKAQQAEQERMTADHVAHLEKKVAILESKLTNVIGQLNDKIISNESARTKLLQEDVESGIAHREDIATDIKRSHAHRNFYEKMTLETQGKHDKQNAILERIATALEVLAVTATKKVAKKPAGKK